MSAPATKKQKAGNGDAVPVGIATEADIEEYLAEAVKLQEAVEKVDEKASEEVIDIENKYNVERRPLLKERAEKLKRIPFFWAKIISQFPDYDNMKTDADDTLLSELISMECIELEDCRKGWDLVFEFGPNDYLEGNLIFTKSIRRNLEEPFTREQTLPKPSWKPKKNLTVAEDRKKMSIKGEEGLKFFDWFFGDGTAMEVSEEFDEIAERIKASVWVDPIKAYNDDSDDEEIELGEDESGEEEEEEGAE